MELTSETNIFQNIQKKSNNNDLLVGVLGGTAFDAHYGAIFLNKKNINTLPIGVSSSPAEQTILQLSKKKLTMKVIEIIKDLISKKCSIIFIYCNSLSVSLNLIVLRKIITIPIITTMDSYKSIAINESSIAIIAANCQSLANIEKMMLRINSNITVVGFSALNIVNDIEKGVPSYELIKRYNLVSLCRNISQNGVRKILIGCTHFDYFYDSLIEIMSFIAPQIQFVAPSDIMYQNLRIHIETM